MQERFDLPSDAPCLVDRSEVLRSYLFDTIEVSGEET